ncbi:MULTISPECIES: hypothetical protein [Actinosynnema]|uniref:hypothetical protein n=1 Tax=Actinosynnema TaxID=40566 RepID=UPI0020A2F6BF|nr:hypothetical protein [Actinosynnema pretiosum]MCP2099316.1 hypothetical protein [Actinosynnema pretiosum]
MDMKSIQTLTQNMTGFRQAAESGGFAISSDGAQAYLDAIDQALRSLDDTAKNLHTLSQEVRLGTSPDALAIAKYNLENATGGSGTIGIVPALNQLTTALSEARAAVQKAIENYEANDLQTKKTLDKQ